MTPEQRAMRKVADELEEVEKRSAEIISGEDIGDELDKEIRELAAKKTKLLEKRSALRVLLETEDAKVIVHDEPDAEMRERIELRSRARLTNYITRALKGLAPEGAEREFSESCGVEQIPIELLDPIPSEKRALETRADTPTPSPSSNTGVNLENIFPSIFARAVVPRLGVAMPRVPSGGYATGTITTDLSAAAVAKGTAQESTAGAITTKATTPHRVTARMSIRIEDVASIGVGNFESALRQNLMLAMSDQLDKLGLNGDGQNANPHGLLPQLTDPTDPTEVVDWPGFVSAMAGGIDGGPWAETLMNVKIVVNAETMRLAETTFQKPTTSGANGEMSAAAYLRMHSGGFLGSSRMPATATTIAQALRYRAGTVGLDSVNAVRTAVCPVWQELGIDDIFSDSASGTRHFTLHALVGDILLVQPSAYQRVDLKLA